MKFVDNLYANLSDVIGEFNLKYNKHYIGIEQNNIANNFIYFHPNKKAVIFNIRLDKSDEYDEKFENSDLDMLSYDKQWRVYRIRLKENDFINNLDLLKEMALIAKKERLG